ncbi:MAG: methylenetetrahydrofolate reductase [Proteobacteria bacterium]|nr:methylenetetrahydrofolate reductase [Pseudomonadota bacterium]
MTFKDSLKTKDFVVTAHVNLAEAMDAESLLRQGEILRPVVDAIQLSDSAQIHMSGVAAAALLIQNGLDPIVHMNCRDRNRIALQKDLIGAAALGVTSVLVMRGKTIPDGKKLEARNVFDITALELMAYIQSLKQAEDRSLVSRFLVGANAEIFDPQDDWTPKNLIRKCDAGANFVQLQICFDLDITRNYMARIVASRLTHRARFIMALAPLPSADSARWVRDNVKGALVPDPVIERLEGASDPEREGIEICAELMQELAAIPGVSGANLLTLGKLEAIPAAIEASGVRPA